MTKNAALNHLRDKKFAVEISDIPILDDKDIELDYYRKEKELLIKLAVEQMPPQRRKIFTMSRYQGMSNDEIAKSLGLSKHTVENHLSISLKEIRELMVAFVVFFLI
jgi:RNA polymerase sigma-70 factor (ECF subfamily)